MSNNMCKGYTLRIALVFLSIVFAHGYALADGWVRLPPDAEIDTDRPGMDYNSFDLSNADCYLCYNACENDPTCKAWTYVKPGIQGQNARCWLKSGVPTQVQNTCCISGYKSRSGSGFTPHIFIEIKSNPSGAQIWTDGVNTRTTTSDTPDKNKIYIDSGKHTIELRLDGYSTYTARLDVGGLSKGSITMTLCDADGCPSTILNPSDALYKEVTLQPSPKTEETLQPSPKIVVIPTSTLKGDLNNNGIPADAGDLVLMKRASIGEISADSRYDLNNNGVPADAGDLVLMKRASIGEINL